MHTQSRDLLLQVLSDRNIGDGQVAYALSSCGPFGRQDPETIEKSKGFLQQRLPAASSQVIEDYFRRNAESVPIDEIYGVIKTLEVRSPEELRAIFLGSGDGWKEFRQTFPRSQGTLQISGAGFSSDGMQAMISIGQQLGWLMGHGVCYLYGKTESWWSKLGEVIIWIS
jgi:hypothetical protein